MSKKSNKVSNLMKVSLLVLFLSILAFSAYGEPKVNDEFPLDLTDTMKPNAYKYCNRSEITGVVEFDPSEFLAKLWAVYGEPPSVNREGFAYQVKDRLTEIIFLAYSGPSGPAYCFSEEDRGNARKVLERFELFLSRFSPVDCNITVESDFGPVTIGFLNSKPIRQK